LLTKSNNQYKKPRSWKHVFGSINLASLRFAFQKTTDIAGSLLTLDLYKTIQPHFCANLRTEQCLYD